MKGIEYKGYTVMPGSRLFELLQMGGKDPKSGMTAEKQLKEIEQRHKELTGAKSNQG